MAWYNHLLVFMILTIQGVKIYAQNVTLNKRIHESVSLGYVVYNFSPTIDGSRINATVNIISGNTENTFAITNRKLVVLKPLDYERVQSYVLVVEYFYLITYQFLINIVVTDVNDNRPIFTKGVYIAVIPENAAIGTSVLQLFAIDFDASSLNNRITFQSLLYASDFNISADGTIRIAKKIDFERQQAYSLTATVRDNGTPYLDSQALVNIKVSNINDEPPRFNKLNYKITVTEKIAVGTTLLTLEATDKDTATENLVYAFVGEGDSPFVLQQGKVILNKSLDLESNNRFTYTASFSVRDGKFTGNVSALLTVSVLDVNDNQPVFSSAAYVLSIQENISVGTTLLQVHATDNDVTTENNKLFYSIKSGLDSNYFTMTGNQLFTARSFDYEIIKSVLFYMQVVNDASTDRLTGIASVKVDILDVNDNVPIITNPFITVKVTENTLVGSNIATIHARDKDSGTNSQLVYSLTSQHFSTFSINNYGEIKSMREFNAVLRNRYEIKVAVTDSGIPRLGTNSVVIVNVQPNEVSNITFNNCPYNISLDENHVSPFITTFSVTDSTYSSPNVSYVILYDHSKMFSISSDGKLSMKLSANYEVRNRYSFLVVATTQLSAKAYCYVTANINDINEAPYFVNRPYGFNVSESVAPFTIVYSVTAIDPDLEISRNSLRYYSLLLTGDAVGKFDINEYGQIRVISNLDYEKQTEYTFTVAATDSGFFPITTFASIKVSVLDWNDNSPKILNTSLVLNLKENSISSSLYVVGKDLDASIQNNGIKVVGIYPTGILKFVPYHVINSGFISLVKPLNYEERRKYELMMVVRDTGTPYLSSFVNITLNVIDVNDNAPVFDSPVYQKIVTETAAIGTTVLKVHATDKDVNQSISYSILYGNSKNMFQINQEGHIIVSGFLVIANSGLTSYNMVIVASDNLFSTQASIVIKVVTQNASKIIPSFSRNTYYVLIPESIPINSSIIKVGANRKEVSSLFIYSIVPSDSPHVDSKSFAINSNGVIHNVRLFDYKTKDKYVFQVEVEDVTNLKRNRALVVVEISHVNNTIPQFSSLKYNLSTSESTVVGSTLSTLNVKGSKKNLFFSIKEGDTKTFTLSNTGTLLLMRTLDRERRDNYSLVVVVSDGNSSSIPAVITITILDFNDNPPVFTKSCYNKQLTSSTPVNTMVTVAYATDIDSRENAQISYSFLPECSLFKINSVTGEVTTNGTFSYEKQYKCIIKASDSGSPKLMAFSCLTVDVKMSANKPVFLRLKQVVKLQESVPIGSLVTCIYATVNNGNKLKYTVTEEGDVFTADDYGCITTVKILDFETKRQYRLEVMASDFYNATLISSQNATVLVHVIDVNDNTPIFIQNLYTASVPENSVISNIVLTVSATDRDGGIPMSTLTYHLDNQDFIIDAIRGNIFVNRALKYQEKQSHQFVVTVADSGTPPLMANTNVHITVINTNNNSPFFPTSFYNITMSDQTLIGTLLLPVQAEDKDGDKIYYKIISGNVNNIFSIFFNKGYLMLHKTLANSKKMFFTLKVQAVDIGGRHSTNDATIRINIKYTRCSHSNQLQPFFLLDTYFRNIPHNTGIGESILTVKASSLAEQKGPFYYSIIPSSFFSSSFTINRLTGVISTSSSFNVVMLPQFYLFNIEVVDTHNLKTNHATAMFTIDNKNNKVFNGEWSSWTLVSDCVKTENEYTKLYWRSCDNPAPRNGGKCIGDSRKYEQCKPRNDVPLTVAATGKANGKLTVKNLLIGGKGISDVDLTKLLQPESASYDSLKKEVEDGLLALYKKNKVDVKKVTVTKLSVGSLVVDYIVEVNTKTPNATFKSINPVKVNTNPFNDNSTYKGVTSPQLSEITDYDECGEANSCDKNAYCINFGNSLSYGCQCKDSYTGNGFKCKEEKKSSILVAVILGCLCGVFVILSICTLVYCIKQKRYIKYYQDLRNKEVKYDPVNIDEHVYQNRNNDRKYDLVTFQQTASKNPGKSNSGYDPVEFSDKTFVATEVNNSGYDPVEFSDKMFVATEVNNSAYDPVEFSDETFVATEVNDSAYDPVEIPDKTFVTTEINDSAYDRLEFPDKTFVTTEINNSAYDRVEFPDTTYVTTEIKISANPLKSNSPELMKLPSNTEDTRL